MAVLRKGLVNRHIGSTNMNVESSRSHSVFSIFIESKKSESGICKLRKSQFHFVDLAGSERQKKTEARGERLKEGCNINKSLTVLGGVINSLVDSMNGKKVHVRYRDSKLTFLLRDSLGGNSKTAMIANISPAASAYHETLSTLQFAQRAKLIKNRAVQNEDATGDCEALRLEIRRLREELESTKGLIANLELPGFSTHGSMAGCNQRQAMDYEQLDDLQLALDESVAALLDTQAALQCEISRKEDLLGTVQKYFDVQQRQEHQYSLVLRILEDKDRPEEGVPRPLVYQSFDYEAVAENIMLKERLWRLENAQIVPDCRLVRRAGTRVVEQRPVQSQEAQKPPLKIQNELTAADQGKPDMSRRYAAAALENAKLRQQLETATASRSEPETTVVYRTPPELERELETLKLDLLQSEEEKDTLSRSLDYFKDEYALQRAQLESEISRLKTCLGEQEVSKGQESMLSKQLIEEERSRHISEISSLNTKITEAEKNASFLKSALDSEKQAGVKRLSDLQETLLRLDQMSKDMEEVRQVNESLTAEIESTTARSKELQYAASQLSKDKEDLSRKLGKDVTTVANLKHQLSMVEAERDCFEEKLRDRMVQVDHQALDIDDLNNRIKYQLDMISDLRHRHQTAVNDRNKIFRHFNALHNSIAEIHTIMETGSATSIMKDLVEASNLKQQVYVLNKALHDRENLFGLAKSELETVKAQFREEMAALKRDYDSLEVDYSKLCVMVELRKPLESKGKQASYSKNKDHHAVCSKENNSQLEKQMQSIFTAANADVAMTKEANKHVFRANINATNLSSQVSFLPESSETTTPLSDSQNLPSLAERKLKERVEKQKAYITVDSEDSKSPFKDELNDRPSRRASKEDGGESCLGKRLELEPLVETVPTLNSSVKAKWKLIAEANLSAELPESLALRAEAPERRLAS